MTSRILSVTMARCHLVRTLSARLAPRMARSMSSAPPPKIRVLVSATTDPFFNLATEEYLFRSGDVSVNTLFLWRNEPTVVIGRCQNPWKECNMQAMDDKGVHLARRFSGGGAVYQDLGNTNFTFLSSMENYNKERNSGIIMKGLEKFGVKANTSGRNDIEVDGQKVSGAAYRLAPPRALHHGTLLINVEMTALAGLLNPNKLKLKSKGISSVTARVSNLQSLNPAISHESLSSAVVDAFCAHYASPRLEPEMLDASALQQEGKLAAVYAEIKDKMWRFGETPEFTHHIEGRFESPLPWGSIDVHIQSQKGEIVEAKAMARLAAVADPAAADKAHVSALGDWLKASL